MSECYYCGSTDRALRPYGPGGSWVCLPCITATPERDAAAGAVFGALLDAAQAVSPTGIAAIGTSAGPMAYVGDT